MNTKTRRLVLSLMLGACAAACASEASPDDEPLAGSANLARAENSEEASLADPREYLRVHNLASDTEADGWRGAIEVLASAGDAFTLEHFGGLDQAGLSGADKELLASAISKISARLLEAAPTNGAGQVVARLERAAYADLMCDALEGPLKNWTLEAVEAELHDSAVVAELQRLEESYTPRVDLETMFSSMSERVPWYAKQLLESAPKHDDQP